MRIVSLLPSLTELVCALGRGDELVGVTHECDYPPGVELLPHLTHSRIAPEADSAAIDRAVSEQGGSLYELDAEGLAELRPDLILTQEQCDVCAVNEATVRRVALGLAGPPRVVSVNPTDLAGVFAMFDEVADLLDARPEAEALRTAFDDLARADRRARRRPGPARGSSCSNGSTRRSRRATGTRRSSPWPGVSRSSPGPASGRGGSAGTRSPRPSPR